MPKLVFQGGGGGKFGWWGGKFGWWRDEKALRTGISLHLSSNLPEINSHTKFHQNQMRNAKVSILGWWGW